MQNNFESISLIISILGIIGTWVTIALVFFTLKEMEKQRRESYKPVIVVPQFGLQAEAKIIGEITVFENLIRGGFHEEDYQSYAGIDSAKKRNLREWDQVVLYNLGAGAAKDIEIEWKLDFQLSETVEKIKEFFYKNSIPLIVEIEEGSLKIHKNFKPENNFVYNVSVMPCNEKIDYLLPQTVEPSGIRLRLPIIYQEVIYLLATIYKYKNPDWSSPDLPLILDIKYRDIGNKKYNNKYRLRMAHHFIVTNHETEATSFDALFETSQIR